MVPFCSCVNFCEIIMSSNTKVICHRCRQLIDKCKCLKQYPIASETHDVNGSNLISSEAHDVNASNGASGNVSPEKINELPAPVGALNSASNSPLLRASSVQLSARLSKTSSDNSGTLSLDLVYER